MNELLEVKELLSGRHISADNSSILKSPNVSFYFSWNSQDLVSISIYNLKARAEMWIIGQEQSDNILKIYFSHNL